MCVCVLCVCVFCVCVLCVCVFCVCVLCVCVCCVCVFFFVCVCVCLCVCVCVSNVDIIAKKDDTNGVGNIHSRAQISNQRPSGSAYTTELHYAHFLLSHQHYIWGGNRYRDWNPYLNSSSLLPRHKRVSQYVTWPIYFQSSLFVGVKLTSVYFLLAPLSWHTREKREIEREKCFI